MKFSKLAIFFQKLESTSSRNAMTEILAELFKEADASEIDKICYLTQGRVAPLFVPLEFGMADRMMIKAISLAYGVDVEKIEKKFKQIGDLGLAATNFSVATSAVENNNPVLDISPKDNDSLRGKRGSSKIVARHSLSVSEVFSVLEEIAQTSGIGSVVKKIKLLADLMQGVDPLSVQYLVRIPLAKMRLGFSDMTVLDGLSWMIGKSKKARKEIEKAYNVRPDLGLIARVIKEKGIKGTKGIGSEVGTPILMARAERLSSGEEIIEKIGKCAVEGKYDGLRIQVHYGKVKSQKLKVKNTNQNLKLFEPQDTSDGGPERSRRNSSEVEEFVRLFSRNLEDVTSMYPDIVEGVVREIKANEAIFEGEAIAYDPKTGRYLPFQETVQRKRKYDIEAMSKSVPLKLIVFDLLYVNGENLIDKSFIERRKKLEEIIR